MQVVCVYLLSAGASAVDGHAGCITGGHMGAMNQEMKGVPNVGWNEPRIFDGVDLERYRSNWAYIQANEKLVNEYCEAEGLDRSKFSFDTLLELATRGDG